MTASTTVRSLVPLNLTAGLLLSRSLTEFPSDPTPGMIVMKGGVLWVYSTMNGLTTWFPINSPKNTYTARITTASYQWNIEHGLGTDNLIFAAYDTTGALVYPAHVPEDENSFRLMFTTETAGHIVIFADVTKQSAAVVAESMRAAQVIVGSGSTLTEEPDGLKLNGETVATMNVVESAITASVADKVTIEAMDTALEEKADTTATISAITASVADKVSIEAMNTAIANAVADKVTTTAMNNALAAKANTTTVNTALAAKADTTAMNTAIANAVADKVTTTAMNSAIASTLSNHTFDGGTF